jgi:transposase-like protein
MDWFSRYRGKGARDQASCLYPNFSIKQQIVDMAMNASGIRDTARVLHVSPTTVIKEFKKAQFGFQGVDSAPSREGRSPGIGLLCRLVQWAILV